MKYLIFHLLYMPICWTVYLAVMAMKKRRYDPTISVQLLGKSVYFIGLVMNIYLNIVVYTVLFLDPPREWYATDRMDRYLKKGRGIRYKIAKWICEEMLNPFDEKGHCS